MILTIEDTMIGSYHKEGEMKKRWGLVCVTLLVITMVITGCAMSDFLEETQTTSSISVQTQNSGVSSVASEDEEQTSENEISQQENPEPKCFDDVSIAHQAWDSSIDVFIDSAQTDPEGGEPYIQVTSDNQQKIRRIWINARYRVYWEDEGISADEAVEMARGYIDLDYLNQHYVFNSSYKIEDDISNTDTYYIVYDPDESEQYGRFYVELRTMSGEIKYVIMQNEKITEYGDLGACSPENVRSNTDGGTSRVVAWDARL